MIRKILIAPDKFKGSISATEVVGAIARGLRRANPEVEVISLPLADGGEGTLDLLEKFLDTRRISVQVQDPIGRPIEADYLMKSETAYIELAQAAGMYRLSREESHPGKTSTFGTGQQIKHALANGAKEIYLFLGGSATNDLGTGIAAALGYQFFDKNRNKVFPKGHSLFEVSSIDDSAADPSLKACKFYCAVDVQNPLLGPEGAVYTYAIQKAGKSTLDLPGLENGMRNCWAVIQKDLKPGLKDLPGFGSAGGVGAGAKAFLDAELIPGTNLIFDWIKFDDLIRQVDYVITGEGKLDKQTLSGKLVKGVFERTQMLNKPLVIFAGIEDLEPASKTKFGNTYMDSIFKHAGNLEDALQNAPGYLETMAFEWMQGVNSQISG